MCLWYDTLGESINLKMLMHPVYLPKSVFFLSGIMLSFLEDYFHGNPAQLDSIEEGGAERGDYMHQMS